MQFIINVITDMWIKQTSKYLKICYSSFQIMKTVHTYVYKIWDIIKDRFKTNFIKLAINTRVLSKVNKYVNKWNI